MTQPRIPDGGDDAVLHRLRAAGEALTGAADAHPGSATVDPFGGRAPHRPRRLGLGLALAGAAAVAVVAGAIVWSADEGEPRDRLTTAESVECTAAGDLLAVEVNTAVGEGSDFRPEGAFGVGVLRSGGSALAHLADGGQVLGDPSFSPSGDQVAVRWADGDYESAGPESESIWIIDADDGEARPLTNGRYHTTPRWSPDGEWIAYSSRRLEAPGRTVLVVPVEGGEPRPLGDLGEARQDGQAWTSAGDALIAWGNDETTSTVWRLGLDGERRQLAEVEGVLDGAELAPGDAELVAEVLTPGRDEISRVAIDLATGAQRPIDGPDGTRPDRPLIGTEWRLGRRQVLVTDGPARPGCDGPSCTSVRIEVRDEASSPEPCAVAIGELRGTDLDLSDLEVTAEGTDADGSATCWSTRGWEATPPDGLEVRGDLLRLRTPVEGYAGEDTWGVAFGAS